MYSGYLGVQAHAEMHHGVHPQNLATASRKAGQWDQHHPKCTQPLMIGPGLQGLDDGPSDQQRPTNTARPMKNGAKPVPKVGAGLWVIMSSLTGDETVFATSVRC